MNEQMDEWIDGGGRGGPVYTRANCPDSATLETRRLLNVSRKVRLHQKSIPDSRYRGYKVLIFDFAFVFFPGSQ